MTEESERAAQDADPAGAAKRGRGRPPGSKNKPRPGDGPARVLDMLANTTPGPTTVDEALARAAEHADRLGGGEEPWAGVEPDAEPSDMLAERVDPAAVAECAALDQSDTDNGRRLLTHFGRDMMVLETEGASSADWMVWTGTHWDGATGNDASLRMAQKVGARIALEADLLAYSPAEVATLKRAEPLMARNASDLTPAERQAVEDAKAVPAALAGRRRSRRSFGVTTKNQGRIVNMLRMAAPHVTCPPDQLNADPNLVAVAGHTLRFVKATETVRERDLECPDPDVERFVERQVTTARVEVMGGHQREHRITKLMPVAYDPKATAPRWLAFLEEYSPTLRCGR